MVYTISFGFNTKSIKCVNNVYDKNTNTGHFKLPSVIMVIYFQNMCKETCDFSRKILKRILCFLNGFGIVIPIFSYMKHPTQSSIV